MKNLLIIASIVLFSACQPSDSAKVEETSVDSVEVIVDSPAVVVDSAEAVIDSTAN